MPERRLGMPLVAALLFTSGACALVYQVAWLRELRLVFGASTAASSAAVAIFIAGLGAGGLIFGRRAERAERPLELYARFELGIALAAAVSPLALVVVRALYISLGGAARLGGAGGTVVRVLLAAVVLAPPTLLMGGTLPAASRAVVDDSDATRGRVATLYAANTLGAVVGALATTFLLLEVFGTRLTLWAAALLNLLVAIVARSVARGTPALPASSSAADGSRGAPSPDTRLVLAAAGIVGFSFFLLEIVWYRLLGPILGGSVFTFGLILAVALAGIGIGSAAWSVWSRTRTPTMLDLAWTCTLEAAFVGLGWALGDRIALLCTALTPFASLGFLATLLTWSLVASIVVLPASVIAGAQFPLLIALLGHGRTGVSRDVGLAYGFNTAGATLGALAGGFGLLPLIGLARAYRLAAGLLLVLGALVVLRAFAGGRVRASLSLGTALVAGALLLTPGPTAVFRHSAVGAGRAELLGGGGPNAIVDAMRERRRRVFWEAEGIESSVAMDLTASISFLVNGKSDGSARADAATQVMGGLVGAALHPAPRRALVIGLGTGSTAGWLAAVPGMDRVDVIELEPAIVEVARACAPVNRDVLRDPKVQVMVGDAREALLTARARWDVIFSEPSNPYRAGIASLFTTEYYRAALERLSDGGVFLQWVQAYEIDQQTLRTVIATMADQFAHVEIWMLRANDLLLVGSRQPIAHDLAAIKARVEAEPFRSAMSWSWGASGLEGFYGHFVARASLAKSVLAAERDALNTDDRTLVEFGFARSVGRLQTFGVPQLRALARRRREDRPETQGGTIDWELALDVQNIAVVREMLPLSPTSGAPEPVMRRAHALVLWMKGDLEGAAAAWRRQSRPPKMPLEQLAIGEALAELGDEQALSIAEALRAVQPVEADVIGARLWLRQGKLAAAADAVERALLRHRHDPWPHELAVQHAVAFALELAARDPQLAPRMWRALEQPFAAFSAEELRRRTRVELVQLPPLRARCAEAFAAFEPHTPWEAPFLTLRRDCYAARGDARAATAQRELAEFLSAEPVPFAQGL